MIRGSVPMHMKLRTREGTTSFVSVTKSISIFPLTASHTRLNLFLNKLMLIWAMVTRFTFLSVIFLKCSKSVNLPFALESECEP